MIYRIFSSQLPVWARPNHPLMRYAIGTRKPSRRQQVTRAALGLVILVLVIAVSYFFTAGDTGDDSPAYREFMY
jgi:hypothetical protein